MFRIPKLGGCSRVPVKIDLSTFFAFCIFGMESCRVSVFEAECKNIELYIDYAHEH